MSETPSSFRCKVCGCTFTDGAHSAYCVKCRKQHSLDVLPLSLQRFVEGHTFECAAHYPENSKCICEGK